MDQKTFPRTEPVVTSDIYEVPRIEKVLTADELVREIQYAGFETVDVDETDT